MISTLIFCSVSCENSRQMLPGRSSIPSSVMSAIFWSRATPLTFLFSITTSLTRVPTPFLKLLNTSSCTPKRFAISTDRLCSTCAPCVASSSISS